MTISYSQCEIIPVFAGGGTRLPAYVGILKALEEYGIGFQHMVGTSGGSVVAALYCAGWSVERLLKLAMEVEFSRFRGFSLTSLIRRGGLSSGDAFECWLDEQLDGARFRDFSRDLHVVATDVFSQEPVVFDRETTPDFKISTAVRFSVGIPLLFTYKPFGEKLLVDGSILAEDALRRDWGGTGTPLVFFRLRASSTRTSHFRNRYFPLPEYIIMLIRTFLTSLSREYVSDLYWSKTLLVKTEEISPLEFSLNREDKERLFHLGYQTAIDFLPLKLSRIFPAEVV
ncbi:MAG: patatin-like phospholipase family protein [Desulfuromonadaceae bacterium]